MPCIAEKLMTCCYGSCVPKGCSMGPAKGAFVSISAMPCCGGTGIPRSSPYYRKRCEATITNSSDSRQWSTHAGLRKSLTVTSGWKVLPLPPFSSVQLLPRNELVKLKTCSANSLTRYSWGVQAATTGKAHPAGGHEKR